MKICVLHSAYGQSTSPLKEHDAPIDIRPHLVGHEVTIAGIHKATAVPQVRSLATRGFDVFVNLCDGAWDEDRAGIEVVQALERLELPFTGAASDFYEPSRETMKRVCHYYGLATPRYRFARRTSDLAHAAATLRFPLILKHPSSYSSIGMTRDSRVTTTEALQREGSRFLDAYGGVLVEEFIEGREFTVLVVENADDPQAPIVFEPLEYRFPAGESFKHFDLKWVDYETMGSFICTDTALCEQLKAASATFFTGLNGSGFGRCDIRVDAEGVPYILEINPNCAVFYAPQNAGSADLILLGRPDGYPVFIDLILKAAPRRVSRSERKWDVDFESGSQYGLYATRDIAEGELIDAFEERPHVLVSRSHVEKHWGEREKDWFLRYAYPLTDEIWVMWAKHPDDWKPINHACDPNAWLEGLNVVARRRIAKGEQLSLDYATFCHGSMPPFQCSCGSADCRGTITGSDSLGAFMARYGDHVSDYVKTRRKAPRTA